MTLELPPLRERAQDIPLLVEWFLRRDWAIEPEALAAITQYSWPGNVRQLINALERAKILADDSNIRLIDLPAEIAVARSNAIAFVEATSDKLAAVERAHVVDVLRRERGNKARAARVLGVDRRSLYRLVEKYDVRPDELETHCHDGTG